MTGTRPAGRTASLLASSLIATALAVAPAAHAQARCPSDGELAPAGRLTPPLDRVVPGATAPIPVPLRTALDQLAAAAGVRLSYSRELLPLDRPSCLPATRAPLGAVLAQLLQGTGVQSVGVGDDQVVLAPALSPPASSDATPVAPRAAVLEQVVVTGSATGAPSRRLPFTLDVVEAEDGAAGTRAALPLAGTLDGHVPGLWLWAQPPTAVLTRYGSLRGASSFGVSTPKLYLDGVEVANPLVVTELPAERIARIEVIRGPQGAALYGADAISGVINVVTRHDGASEGATGGRTFLARGGIGGAGSDYAGRPAVAQDYALLLRTGTGARTAGASLSASTLGAYAPGAASRRLTATGDLRRVGPAGTVSASLRLADVATSTPLDPQLSALLATQAMRTDGPPAQYDRGTTAGYTAESAAPYTPAGTTATVATLPRQRLQQLTAGVTLTRAGGTRWTNALTAGVDAYRLSGVATDLAPAVSLLDSAQRAARGGAARLTLRGSSTATFDLRPGVRATVLALADYGLLRDATTDGALLAMPLPDSLRGEGGHSGGEYEGPEHGERPSGSLLAPGARNAVAYLGTAGLVGQATFAFDDAVFVTAGLRGERNDGFTSASRFAALPSVGAAVVRALGTAGTVKLRAAYGSGLRPARTATRAVSWRGAGAFSADLTPETQRGVEAGVDVYLDGGRGSGRRGGAPAFALHLTRFDQQATHLLQQVTLAPPDGDDWGWRPPANAADSARRRPRYLYYEVEDVGAITNRGWEFAGDLRAGPLTLAATYSLVDSRVRRTAPGYNGDLRPGDRMLEVPRHTAGLSALWQHAGWSATLGAARAGNWINYDRLALAAAVSDGTIPPGQVGGAALRGYWRRYPGVTRLEATAARDLRRGLAVVLAGSNLLDRQQGEPDNTTLVPGRTVTLGVRARF